MFYYLNLFVLFFRSEQSKRMSMKNLIVFSTLLVSCVATRDLDTYYYRETTSQRDDFTHTIRVQNGGPWGSWGKTAVYCPAGTYAIGYAQKVCFFVCFMWQFLSVRSIARKYLGMVCKSNLLMDTTNIKERKVKCHMISNLDLYDKNNLQIN